MLKSCVIRKLLENKKNRKPTLKDILRKAISEYRQENSKKAGKHGKHSDDEEEEEERTIKEDYMLQPEFFDLVAQDLVVSWKYNSRALATIWKPQDQNSSADEKTNRRGSFLPPLGIN